MRWKLLEVNGKQASDLLVSDLQYKILKCTRHGIPTGRYLAFAPRINDRPQLIDGFDDSIKAKAACEEHLKCHAVPA